MKKEKVELEVIELGFPVSGSIREIKEKYGKQLLKKEYSNIVFEINYPITTPYRFIIKKAKTVADVLIAVTKMYKKMYKSPTNEYGLILHGISELVYTHLYLCQNRVCEAGIDS